MFLTNARYPGTLYPDKPVGYILICFVTPEDSNACGPCSSHSNNSRGSNGSARLRLRSLCSLSRPVISNAKLINNILDTRSWLINARYMTALYNGHTSDSHSHSHSFLRKSLVIKQNRKILNHHH